jgi:hypothetical protein
MTPNYHDRSSIQRPARDPRPAEIPARQDYCLRDGQGHPLGRVAAPVCRPVVGPSAPTVYLQRQP